MSLKAIAERELARLKAGEMGHETERETEVKQMKQSFSCFIEASSRFTPMKQDHRQKTAKKEPCFTVSYPKGETHETGLPGDVIDGLARLKSMSPLVRVNSSRWPVVVRDALQIGADGWAATALALGWTPLDLFGAVVDPLGDPFADGLAVKLAGRSIIAMCASFATVDLGNGGRVFLHRDVNECARLLWELTN